MRIYCIGLGWMLVLLGIVVCWEFSYLVLLVNLGVGVCEVCECVVWIVIVKIFFFGVLMEFFYYVILGFGLFEIGWEISKKMV